MQSQDNIQYDKSSLEKRVNPDLWTRIEQASDLGKTILQAQEHRGVGQILTPDQIRALASASGVIEPYAPTTPITQTAFFPKGNLPEETLHELSDNWRDSNVIFARTIPSNYVHSPQLEKMGIEEAPEHYQRNAS